ncbi:hypothetical protein EDD11_004259 [Mortierella claussenii]|nr:hypothetical protein EDD11_004259 [Mortierella claussenii]
MAIPLKAFCLLSALYGYFYGAVPPTPKTQHPQEHEHEQDKIHPEKDTFRSNIDKLPMRMAYIATLETLFYLGLMVFSAQQASHNYYHSHINSRAGGGGGGGKQETNDPQRQLEAALAQLQIVRPWHILAAVGAVLGYALRKWSFTTLDRFFTFQLKIRPGHQLITSGPYRYLRHPSYTGGIINGFCLYMLLFHQGLWDVSIAFLKTQLPSSDVLSKIVIPGQWSAWSLWISSFSPRPSYSTATTLSSSAWSPLWSFFLNIPGGVLFVSVVSVVMVRAIVDRVRNEEIMLKDHFGKEWDTFASQRWRLFPFVY